MLLLKNKDFELFWEYFKNEKLLSVGIFGNMIYKSAKSRSDSKSYNPHDAV